MDGIGTKWKAGITEAIDRLAIGSITKSQRVGLQICIGHRSQKVQKPKYKPFVPNL